MLKRSKYGAPSASFFVFFLLQRRLTQYDPIILRRDDDKFKQMVLRVFAANRACRCGGSFNRIATLHAKFSSQVVEVRRYTLSPSSVAKYVDVTTRLPP